MISLTIHFGAGFIAGIALALVVLMSAATRLIKSHDLVVYRRRIVVVDAIATFLAQVVTHEVFVDAVSRTITICINRWIASPESRQALRQVYEEVPKSEIGRKLGKDAVDYTKNFGHGLVETVRENRINKSCARSAVDTIHEASSSESFGRGAPDTVADDEATKAEFGHLAGKDLVGWTKNVGYGVVGAVKEKALQSSRKKD